MKAVELSKRIVPKLKKKMVDFSIKMIHMKVFV